MIEFVLELNDVTRVHGAGETAVHALRGVSLGVLPGELVAVMGPSGSGKSTLLNVAGGLDAPDDGSVMVEGTELGGLSPVSGCSRSSSWPSPRSRSAHPAGPASSVSWRRAAGAARAPDGARARPRARRARRR